MTTTYVNQSLLMTADGINLGYGAVYASMDELNQVRPNHNLTLPAGAVVAFKSADKCYTSDGSNQKAGIDPWPQADALLNDAALAADLETHRQGDNS